MKNNFSNLSAFAAGLLATIALFSCVKHDIIEPPIGGEVVTNIVANATIKELIDAHQSGVFDSIKVDKIIKGVVTADDRSGNFYKELYIQDATGGIQLLLDQSNLYAEYPVGREVFVKLNGLIVGDYQGVPQIGGYIFDYQLGGVQPADVARKVLKGELGHAVTPKSIAIKDIKPADYATLVTITDCEFIDTDIDQYYADFIGKSNTNREIQDCTNKKLTVRTSGFASFARSKTSGKHGTMTGIVGAYNGTPQLYIRDESDAALTEARCDGSTGAPPAFYVDFTGLGTNTPVSIQNWVNVSPFSGGRTWSVKSYSGNYYAEVEAYQDSQANTEAWLITPSFSIATERYLTFQSAVAYWKHDGLKIFYSTNYSGSGDPNAATWTPLTANLPTSGATNFAMLNSGKVTIPAGTGNARVAFKYTGQAASGTTKVQVDNIKVQ